MKINRKNYELFFVDYLDGKLSHSDELELKAFLAVNPDLEDELNLVRDIKIEPEKISFSAKDSLKKNTNESEISSEKFNELCVGKVENTLTHAEEVQLANHLQLHPELQKEFRLFEMTVAQPDYSIEFSGKELLKHVELTTEKVNELLVAKIENELNKEQEVLLAKQLKQNPKLEKELELFSQTVLKPDLSEVFPAKASLKRSVIGISYKKIVFRSLSAAAAIILLMTLYFTFNKEERFGNAVKTFANIIHPVKFKTNQVIHKNTNTEKKQTNRNIKKQINQQKQYAYNDTTPVIEKHQNVISPENTNTYIAANTNQQIDTTTYHQVPVKNVVRSNDNINKSYEAIFADTKYSHFRDMIENVPFQAIQPGPSGLSSMGIWDVVEAGSKGISAVTGADIDFKQKTDKKRNVEKYSFRIGRFGFSRTVHK